jgi:hypothetical protein
VQLTHKRTSSCHWKQVPTIGHNAWCFLTRNTVPGRAPRLRYRPLARLGPISVRKRLSSRNQGIIGTFGFTEVLAGAIPPLCVCWPFQESNIHCSAICSNFSSPRAYPAPASQLPVMAAICESMASNSFGAS